MFVTGSAADSVESPSNSPGGIVIASASGGNSGNGSSTATMKKKWSWLKILYLYVLLVNKYYFYQYIGLFTGGNNSKLVEFGFKLDLKFTSPPSPPPTPTHSKIQHNFEADIIFPSKGMSFIRPSDNNIIVHSWNDWYYRDDNEAEYQAAEAEEREELLRQDLEEREAELRGDRPEEEEEVVVGEEEEEEEEVELDLDNKENNNPNSGVDQDHKVDNVDVCSIPLSTRREDTWSEDIGKLILFELDAFVLFELDAFVMPYYKVLFSLIFSLL